MAAALAKVIVESLVANVVLPLFTEKKKKEPAKPIIVGGDIIRQNYTEKPQFSKKRTAKTASIITAILMIIAIKNGWLTVQEADLIDDIIEDKIEQVIDSTHNPE